MKNALLIALVFSLALTGWACSQRGPAEEAMTAAQTLYDAVKRDASVYVPDEARAIEEQFAAMKAAFDGGDYAKALADAQAMTDKVNALREASEARRKVLMDSWSDMSAALPPVVESIQARVTELSKMRRLPKEISKETFEAAKAGLDELTQAWSDAVGASEGGDLIGSVSKAESVKAKAIELMNLLGLETPATLS